MEDVLNEPGSADLQVFCGMLGFSGGEGFMFCKYYSYWEERSRTLCRTALERFAEQLCKVERKAAQERPRRPHTTGQGFTLTIKDAQQTHVP